MKERNRERLFVLCVMLLVAGLVLAMQQGCGTVTLRYNSSGKETAKD
jgi:hypothetical protein